MAKKWTEVTANPEFVALPYADKIAVRDEYWANVVEPNVPEDLRQVERIKFEDYATIEKPTTGVKGAFGSSVDRLQAGAQQLVGMSDAAEANIAEANKYEPMSYKDVDGWNALGYVAENVAGAAPYVAAPLVATGAAVAGAPAAVVGGLTLAGAATYGALEAGAVYAEQTDKSVVRAGTVGVLSAAMERIPGLQGKSSMLLNSPLLSNVIRKGVEEGVTTTAQVAAEGVIGHGQDFTTAMSNLDEALMGSAAARSGISTTTTIANSVPKLPERVKSGSEFIWGGRDEDGNRTEYMGTATKTVHDIDSMDKASDLAAVDPDRGVKAAQEVWTSRELQNSAEAAKKLQDRGAELSPISLDIETKQVDPVTRVEKSINIAEEFNIGTVADKLSRGLANTFKMPLFGSLVDPKKGYESTKKAYDGLKSDFDVEMKREIGNLNLDKEITTDILRDIQNYVSGRKPKSDFETKKFILQSVNRLEIFDAITQMKRMRQMTENMLPGSEKGSIGGYGALGAEAIVSGGLPVLTASAGAIGSTLAYGMNKVQKNKAQSIISGKGTPESKLNKLFELLNSVEFDAEGINRAGFAEGLAEEVEQSITPDMGTMEVVR